jgi:acetyl-CoA synthetase
VKNTSYDPHNVSIKWFEDGTLNVSANCIDRHSPRAATRSRSSGKATTRTRDHKITYKELHAARLQAWPTC